MGRLGIVKIFERIVRGSAEGAEITADPGGGALVRSLHFGSPGDDAPPLRGDYVVLIPGPGSGRTLAVAYADPKNAGEADPGERRVYARGATGDVVAVIWLKGDGSIQISNASGEIVLGAAGTIQLNGVTIDPAGNITVPGGGSVSSPSVVANGKELDGHTHSVTAAPGTTGPNL